MMDGEAMRQLLEAAQNAVDAKNGTVEIDGTTYSNQSLFDPRKPEPVCGTLKVATLQSLVAYVAANRDDLELNQCVAHIVGPEQVDLLGPITGWFRLREQYVSAIYQPEPFPFGAMLPHSDFMTFLLSRVTPSKARDSLLQLVKRLTVSSSIATTDDGRSQAVEIKKGLSMVESVELPNPMSLAPYRTFPEVEQPESPFIIRASHREGEAAKLALFAADGGRWKLEAVARIADWLIGAEIGVQVLA